MADYYPLLAKALDNQVDTSAVARQAIYERARTALTAQLQVIVPRLTTEEVDRERRSLDDAIARAEAGYGQSPGEPAEVARPDAVRPRAPGTDGQASIRRGGSRRPSLLVAGLLGAVAAPVAFLAWSWRGQPRTVLPPSQPVVVQTAQPASAPKLDERLGSGRPAPTRQPLADQPLRPAVTEAPAVAPPAATTPPPAAPSAARAPDPAPLAVAQRVVLVEEGAGDQASNRTAVGRAVWRLDSVPGGPGLPLETVIRLNVDVAEAGLSLAVTLRRNTDAALPASHTMELTFTPSGENGRPVRDIGLPLLRLDETSRGIAMAGLPVPVKENIFLIGLSDLKGDVDRNRELLLNRPWLEVPLRFASGQKALLLIEKGVSGDRLMADAFRIWDQPR